MASRHHPDPAQFPAAVPMPTEAHSDWEYTREDIILLFYASRGLSLEHIQQLILEYCEVTVSRERLMHATHNINRRERNAGYARLYRCEGHIKFWRPRDVDRWILRKVMEDYEYSESMMIQIITLERGTKPLLQCVSPEFPHALSECIVTDSVPAAFAGAPRLY